MMPPFDSDRGDTPRLRPTTSRVEGFASLMMSDSERGPLEPPQPEAATIAPTTIGIRARDRPLPAIAFCTSCDIEPPSRRPFPTANGGRHISDEMAHPTASD